MMKLTKFFADDRHALFGMTHPDYGMSNIGVDASNLTIVTVFKERAAQTVRLLRSLILRAPNFGGHVLIADGGYSTEEAILLHDFLQKNLRFPLAVMTLGNIESIAKLRNKAITAAKTDWVLMLDNDNQFTGDPFPAINRAISTLGCHFFNIPLLNPDQKTFYAFGGHLRLTMNDHRPMLEVDNILPADAEVQKATELGLNEGFLCSFLSAGASVINRTTFIAAGGYDEKFLKGFEDIDFSIRLNQQGYKIGSSSLTEFVHDTPIHEASIERTRELASEALPMLRESADYLRSKHGVIVKHALLEEVPTDGRDKLVPRAQLLVARETELKTPESTSRAKPRIALVVDSANWAFANIARQIKLHLQDRYEFEVISTISLMENIARRDWTSSAEARAFAQLLIAAPDFDIMHIFWRPLLSAFDAKGIYYDGLKSYSAFLGLTVDDFLDRYVHSACFTTSVYDHFFLAENEQAIMASVFNKHTAGFTVSSKLLDSIYRKLPDIPAPSAVIPDGVDRSIFRPGAVERFINIGDREIVVGWVGNSMAGHPGLEGNVHPSDHKGVYTILIPAIEQLKESGLRLRLHMADRHARQIAIGEMADYYASIDVLVCASAIEGTPNPILEALACGVPIISTLVGIVEDALGPKQREFILQERSVDCLKQALRRLINDPQLFMELSIENIEQAKEWEWKLQAEKYHQFFAGVLDRRQRQSVTT